MTSIKQALQIGKELLNLSNHDNTIDLDVEIILAKILNKTRTYLYTYPEKILTIEENNLFLELINQRAKSYPIAYLTGEKEFYSFTLNVNNKTLIPRPETEMLVDKALEYLDKTKSLTILELGTGSGAIAIAIAKSCPNWKIIAIDKSIDAIKTAQKNATKLNALNIEFKISDWFSNLNGLVFDAIISNPPYISANDKHLFMGDVQFEPIEALVGGVNGLECLNQIIHQSVNYLKNNGILLLEHGFDQKLAVNEILQKCGYQDINCWQDMQMQDRISMGRFKKSI